MRLVPEDERELYFVIYDSIETTSDGFQFGGPLAVKLLGDKVTYIGFEDAEVGRRFQQSKNLGGRVTNVTQLASKDFPLLGHERSIYLVVLDEEGQSLLSRGEFEKLQDWVVEVRI